MEDWRIKDRIISIQNKTKLCEYDVLKATQFLMQKYNIDKLAALTKLLNCAIDKKLVLEVDEKVKGGARKYSKLMNLDEI